MKNYPTYEEYVKHQVSKIQDPLIIDRLLNTEWDLWLNGFKVVFNNHADILRECTSAICLGARTGQEVQALQDMGVSATGIDLKAFPPLVAAGDVHNISFEDESFDFVFSNIFDHALYPKKFVLEIERILRPGGYALMHFYVGRKLDVFGVNQVTSVEKEVFPLFEKVKIIHCKEIQLAGVLSCYNWEVLVQK